MAVISIIIPTFNNWHMLKECIISIQKQRFKIFEIIVVDNNSTDDTSEKVKSFFPNIKLIKNKKNLGVTGGRNTGIRAASKKSDYLLLFDHDIIADKDMIFELLKVAETKDEIGIVTPKIYYWEDKKRIWSAGTGINLWTGQIIFRGGLDKGQYESIEEIEVAPAVMLVKKEVIKRVKNFDDRYFATYEDTDFCFRAREVGFKTYYAPLAIAYHKIPLDSKEEDQRLLTRLYWIGRNRILFMKDFGKNFYIFLFFLPLFILYYFMLSFRNGKLSSFLQFLKGTMVGLIKQ